MYLLVSQLKDMFNLWLNSNECLSQYINCFFSDNKYSETRVGLREAGCKGVLGAAKLAYANVAKESINP